MRKSWEKEVNNLEDGLIKATNVQRVIDILGSKTRANFKKDFIKCTNLEKKLQEKDFDILKFWETDPPNSFLEYGNDSKLIKK